MTLTTADKKTSSEGLIHYYQMIRPIRINWSNNLPTVRVCMQDCYIAYFEVDFVYAKVQVQVYVFNICIRPKAGHFT